MTEEDAQRIAKRYPKRSLWDYLVFGLLALGVGVAIYSALASGLVRSNPPAQATVHSFQVVSVNRIDVEILVQRTDPSKTAECKLIAQAASYDRVGELLVEVPPTSDFTSSHRFSLNTIKEPVAVDVQGCRLTQ